ncbi:MAG: hypothetical protein QM665_08730 [Desulfovibrio sp.]
MEKYSTVEQLMMLPQKAMRVIAPVMALPAALSPVENIPMA